MSGTSFNHLQTKGYNTMKHLLMAIMAVAVAVTFSAPSFAEDKKKEEKKGGHVVSAEEKKKDGGKADDTFGEEKKKDEKGK
jgi:hypothetical protein